LTKPRDRASNDLVEREFCQIVRGLLPDQTRINELLPEFGHRIVEAADQRGTLANAKILDGSSFRCTSSDLGVEFAVVISPDFSGFTDAHRAFSQWLSPKPASSAASATMPLIEAGTKERSAYLFPNHIGWALVFPQSDKDRVAQPIIPGKFRVSDLTNHRRLDPTATFHFGGG
jgi:hypothetical protein